MTKLTVFCGHRGRGGGSSEISDVNKRKSLSNVIQFCSVCTAMDTLQDVLEYIRTCTVTTVLVC